MTNEETSNREINRSPIDHFTANKGFRFGAKIVYFRREVSFTAHTSKFSLTGWN